MISEATFKGKVTNVNNNVFDWIHVFDGDHFQYKDVIGHYDMLDDYDAVIFVDADRRLVDAASIALECKPKTIFYPEGTIQTYLHMPFDHQRMFHDLLRHLPRKLGFRIPEEDYVF